MSKCYKRPTKKHIKKQTQYKTKENTKKILFKIKKFCYTNPTQYLNQADYCFQNQFY